MKKQIWISVYLTVVLVLSVQIISAQTTNFTYQGRLLDGSAPANGNYDFQFDLRDTMGATLGTNNINNVVVTNGVFSVTLDFGVLFSGASRLLQIRVRPAGNGAFTTLSPLQQVKSSPYSIKSLDAAQLGGIAANQYVLSGATSINAATQFNIGGERVLSIGGSQNTFVGINAGAVNTGQGNSFFGDDSGRMNSTGELNSFFGFNSGDANTTGSGNSFFGGSAGGGNTTGSENAFFGRSAGLANTIGTNNSYFGFEAGRNNITGSANSIFGWKAGRTNAASLNSFFGNQAGEVVSSGGGNSFFGTFAGQGSTTGEDNTFMGRSAGASNTTGSNNTVLGSGANVGSNNLTFATAIGAGATVSNSNTIVLGRTSDRVIVRGNLNVDGNPIFSGFSNFEDHVFVNSRPSGTTPLCISNANAISNCSSSIRYKTNVQTFSSGLSLIQRLRPVSFNWKADNKADMGLIAEEVNEVEPLLITYNDKGEIEGVKYDNVSVVLVNAVKEQQVQIESQQKQIDEQKRLIQKQQSELDDLKALFCSQNPTAGLCKPKEE